MQIDLEVEAVNPVRHPPTVQNPLIQLADVAPAGVAQTAPPTVQA